MTDPKDLKVEFMPGCFDNFDGTQEELEQLQKEILEIFKNMTPEQLEAQSIPLDELPDELLDAMDNAEKRTLQ